MISSGQNDACLFVAQKAETVPEWIDYAAYCRYREKGLRKQAFAHLESFISQAEKWDHLKQRNFVLWLCKLMDSVQDADYGPYPNPLKKRLFAPCFDEWLRREPNSDEACVLRARYLHEFQYYWHALEINPHNQQAHDALAEDAIYDVWYATHHLPYYFIGDEAKAKLTAERTKTHIMQIENPDRRQELSKELTDVEQVLNDWIAFRKEGGNDFAAWCTNKGRNYKWVGAYYY